MKTLLTILLTVSCIANALFVYDHLEKTVYQKGIKDGISKINERIVQEVLQNKKINIKLPQGQKVVLVPQQQNQAKSQVPSNLPVRKAVESAKKDDPNKAGVK